MCLSSLKFPSCSTTPKQQIPDLREVEISILLLRIFTDLNLLQRIHRVECCYSSGSTLVVNLKRPTRKESEAIEKMARNQLLAPTLFCLKHKLVAVTVCRHMDVIKKVSINKFILRFVFCSIYNHYYL